MSVQILLYMKSKVRQHLLKSCKAIETEVFYSVELLMRDQYSFSSFVVAKENFNFWKETTETL